MLFQHHHRHAASFFLLSLTTGATFSRLPDIQLALGVNEAQLGLTLIGSAIGSLIVLTFGAPFVERLGTRIVAFVSLFGATACYAGITLVSNAVLAFALLLVGGVMVGALEINANVQIGRWEASTRRALMSQVHGFWSLGFFITSLLAAAIRQAGISAPLHLAAMFAIVVIAGLALLPALEEAPKLSTHDATKPPLIATPTWALVPLCLIGGAAFLVEGAGVDWSTIYMRDVFQSPPFIGGLGLTFFTAVMAAARLFLGPVVDRYSPRAVVTALLAVCVAGLVAVWLAPHPYVAIIGFGLLGGGCSAVYPLVVSAAAQRTDRPASINIAALAQVSFVVFFLAPPLLGFVAHTFGIRLSYVVCLPLVIASLFAVTALPARPRPAVLPEPLTPNG